MKNIVHVMLMIIGFSVSMACENPDRENPDMIAHYPFNSNANDASGHGNTGMVNGATLTADRQGNENSAYQFDGTDDYILVNDLGDDLDAGEISISLWVKSGISKAQFQLMLCPDVNRLAVSVDYYHTEENMVFWDFGWTGDAGNASGRLYAYETFNSNWHHYVFISSKEQSIMRIYKDGSLLVEETDPLWLLNSSGRELLIGCGQDALGRNAYFFNGILDDIKIYNKILSEAEIADLSGE